MPELTQTPDAVRDIVLRERSISLSEREWKHRLRGYGLSLRDTERGTVVTSITRGVDLCTLGAAA